MRILVCGGRNDADEQRVRAVLSSYDTNPPPTLVHGDAPGTDTLADRVAAEFGWPTEPHPAEWNRYGPRAGPIRNGQMVASGVDLLLAFPGGTGTANTVALARRAGIRTLQIGY